MSAMVFTGRNIEMRDTMPQTVPSAGFSPPCDYSAFAADCFDLSLLPGSTDCEVPLSPINIQHFLAMYSDPTTPPPMFHNNQDKDFDNFENFKAMDDDKNTNLNKPFVFEHFGMAKSTLNTDKAALDQSMDIPNSADVFENYGALKIPSFTQDSSDSNQASAGNVFENFADLKSTINQESSLKNPAMTSMNVFEEFRTLKSPSVCQDKCNESLPGNSYQYHHNSPMPMLNVVKEEPSYVLTPCMGNYPSPYARSVSPSPSPSSSYASNLSPYPLSPSSQMGIKQEQTLDLQEILEESHFLQESMHTSKQGSTSTKSHDMSQKVASFCNILMNNPDPVGRKESAMTSLNPNVQNTDETKIGVFSSSSSSNATKDDDLMKKSIALGNLLLGCGSSGTIPKREPGTSSCKGSSGIPKLEDHALLREVLKDTSFQRKYNLKPFSFDGLGGFVSDKRSQVEVKMEVKMEVEDEETVCKEEGVAGGSKDSLADLSREKIEPVLSMAIEQLRKDVDSTCNVLGIAPDPAQWTVDEVKAWLLWTLRQYNLPVIPMEYFNMDGVGLASLTEEEFQQRSPQCGSTLYAQLEIWKAACQEIDTSGLLQWGTTTNSTCSGSSGDISEDDEVESVPSPTVGKPVAARTGGSHIHLWQFLKELLSSPQVHGSCIRWLDRTKGVFKIEDSVRVARLWEGSSSTRDRTAHKTERLILTAGDFSRFKCDVRFYATNIYNIKICESITLSRDNSTRAESTSESQAKLDEERSLGRDRRYPREGSDVYLQILHSVP